MISKLNLADEGEAQLLWYLQHASYKVEADLIGFAQIPPLMDTVQSLQNCGETFYGYFENDELAGAAAYEMDNTSVTISRMMVHPDHFRKGIAGKLLNCVQELNPGANTFKVSTGLKNIPAIRLYLKYGFVQTGEMEVAPGVFIALFEKKV